MLRRCSSRISASLLLVLLTLASFSVGAQEPDEPSGSEARAAELVERLRAAEAEASRLRRELLARGREEARSQREDARLHREELLAEAGRAASIYRSGGPLVMFPGRPRLGITLRTDEATGGESRGAVVDAVLDGGPAEKAGLRSGDVITHWNGDPLSADGSRAGSTGAALGLIDRARELEVGEEVRLTYLRDGEERTAVVEAEELGPPLLSGELEEMELRRLPRVAPRTPAPHVLPLLRSSPLKGVELVPLNPELGEYFETTSGLLVLTAPDEDLFGLRGGDVILSVGDREPRDTTHLLRILLSYAPGEPINLHVLRKGKRTVLTATLPEHEQARLVPLFDLHGI